MTNEEKMAILREREDHAYELLRTLEPTDGAFQVCLGSIRRCVYAQGELDPRNYEAAVAVCNPGAGEHDEPEPAGIADWGVGDAPGEPGVPDKEPEEAPAASEAPATNDEPQLTKADMLSKLTPISQKYGDLVANAINGMGYPRLSSVPAERYNELLARVEEAVRCRQ